VQAQVCNVNKKGNEETNPRESNGICNTIHRNKKEQKQKAGSDEVQKWGKNKLRKYKGGEGQDTRALGPIYCDDATALDKTKGAIT